MGILEMPNGSEINVIAQEGLIYCYNSIILVTYNLYQTKLIIY